MKLSVIVPCYNSSRELEQCLAALTKSQYGDFEVLVVDDGSTEPLEELVRRHGFKYMRIDGPSGPARARNRGVEQTNSEWVIFIDADVCVHPDTLAGIARAIEENPGIASVIGTYDDSPAYPSFISQYKNLFHRFVHKSFDGPVSTFWAGCGAVRRDAFWSVGGFDEIRYRRPAIEDIELGTWMTVKGHRIILDSRIQVKHLKRWSLYGLLKTDIKDRGIPWTQLMLRSGKLVNTLNVSQTQRLSVALVFMTIASIVSAVRWPMLWFVVAAGAAGVTLLNLDFYRFFLAERGLWFTLRVVPMHWIYFLSCGISVLVGTARHWLYNRTDAIQGSTAAPAAHVDA